jgi:UDP-3-O-[3-hydroxymyristoyl] glucosamine N-acyltransferase
LRPSERYDHLSVLRNADDGSITYYDGTDPEQLAHLRGVRCSLLCRPDLDFEDPAVETIRVPDPKLEFYRISPRFRQDGLDRTKLRFDPATHAHLHEDAEIHETVEIGPNCVIGRSVIGAGTVLGPGVVVHSRTTIGTGCVISAGTVIGPPGVMWVWDGETRVSLEQLGGVLIEDDCSIGANVNIVRGSANEVTRIGRGTVIAHGTTIGHGSSIGPSNHFSSVVAIGGGVSSGAACFFGSGASVMPGRTLGDEVIVGAGAVVTKDCPESGIYAGVPARWVHDVDRRSKMSGVPDWRR